jgi:Cu/Zn superoxide dismutase
VLLQLSLKGVPTGEHAFHIHAVGKCEPPKFESAGGHFNPDIVPGALCPTLMSLNQMRHAGDDMPSFAGPWRL